MNKQETRPGESRTIRGLAIVFNVESELLDDCGRQFREVILPQACTKSFLDKQDIKLNLLHNRELTLARCNHGEGTLHLTVDSRGVSFEFEAPKCELGDRCLEMVRRGDYSGCSFEFWPGDSEEVHTGGKTKIIRKNFKAIGALTIGMDPAYPQTTVNVCEDKAGDLEREQRRRLHNLRTLQQA